jgi:hypothetical protein
MVVNRNELYPGWKMTVRQHGLYFRLLADACAAQHAATATAKEALRQTAHRAAFGAAKSAKDIHRTKEFDAIAGELKRLANVVDPHDPARKRALYVAAQRLEELTRLTSPNWVATLLQDRFKVLAGHATIEGLSPKQLTDLISTANNRIALFKGRETVVDENIPF